MWNGVLYEAFCSFAFLDASTSQVGIFMDKQVIGEKRLIKLAVIQFGGYTVLAILGFAAWMIVFTGKSSILEAIVGAYVHGHITRWTAKLPLWGILMLASGGFSLGAVCLLRNSRREGAYLGFVSFSIGLVTNILFAQNVLLHTLLGILIGWTLLSPIAMAWDNLK